MSFLGKSKKSDLICLAIDLGEQTAPDMKIIALKELITKSKNFEQELVKNMLDSIISERTENENLERQNKEREFELAKQHKEREFELEKQRIELEFLKLKQGSLDVGIDSPFNQNFQKIMPKFNLQTDEISLFLELFERQAKAMKISQDRWVSHLIGILPTEINNLIAREPEEEARDYPHIKSLLLKRFKLTAEKFRQLLVKTQKNPDSTWQDFYHVIKTYLEGWLTGLKIETFEQLKDLMIVDHIKRRAPNDFKEYFLDEWTSGASV